MLVKSMAVIPAAIKVTGIYRSDLLGYKFFKVHQGKKEGFL